jgi:hypothetical protein
VMLALYVIGSTAGLVLLVIRLNAVQEELDRVRAESGDRQREVREEYSAYAHGAAMALACLLAGLGAWYARPQPSARPAGAGRDRARQGTAPGTRDEGDAG